MKKAFAVLLGLAVFVTLSLAFPSVREAMHGHWRSLKDSALAQFFGGLRKAEAGETPTETKGQDLVALVKEKKVEAHTQGDGIESIQVKVRRLVAQPVTVRIPVGTFFVSRRASAQNMVSTHEEEVVLTSNDWVSVSVPVTCANMARAVPGEKDSFAIQRSPQQPELVRLTPVLDKASAEFAVRQAAVWIVTDNANYDGLGTLVGGFMGLGPREIHEAEAAQAMKLVDEAGIDIRKKAIWHDRHQIARELKDEHLKRWLQQPAARK